MKLQLLQISSFNPIVAPPAVDGRNHQADDSARVEEISPATGEKKAEEADFAAKPQPTGKAQEQLSAEEKQAVQQLQVRDREVRAHETAHKAAAGQYARGAASFSYQTGPDGRRYANGGEVSIDTSPINGDPEATVRKAATVRAAALAPAQPSAQDRSVAAAATTMAADARVAIRSDQQVTAENQTSAKDKLETADKSGEVDTKESAEIKAYRDVFGSGATQQSDGINLIV